MQKYILTLLCSALLATVYAQNRSIEFRDGTWQEITEQARKEKKMIFVDCYTS